MNRISSILTSAEKKYPTSIGFLYATIGSLSFVVGHSLVQKASRHLTPIQILYFIGIQVLCYNYVSLSYQGKSALVAKPKTTKMLLFRAFVGFSGACFILSGLSFMPLSEAIVIQMTAPVLTGLLAICFLNEKYNITLFLTTVFSFVGIMLISKPAFIFGEAGEMKEYPLRSLGVILTLIGSFITAVIQITLKKLGSVSDAFTVAFYFGLGLAMGGPVIQLCQGTRPFYFEDLIWLFFLGISRHISHITQNRAYALADANKISLVAYCQVPTSYVVDVFIFGVELNLYSVLGSISVFSCFFVLLYKNLTSSQGKK